MGKHCSDVFYFPIRNRQWARLIAYEPNNPGNLQDTELELAGSSDPDKDVAGKQRQIDHLLAVAPPPLLA